MGTADPADLKSLLPPALAGTHRWWVAFSGGPDSTSLLWAACQAFGTGGVAALHVNHGVSPDANAWARSCAEVCGTLKVALHVHEVPGLAATASEVELREARYAAFQSVLAPDEALLVAHHQDDVAETVLLAALRGGAPQELAGIPELRPLGRGWLWRPWLTCSRAQIHALLVGTGLPVIDDPANTSPRHRRSLLRQEVLPRLQQGWPNVSDQLAGTARRQAQAARVLEELLDAQLPTGDRLASERLDRLSADAQLALVQRLLVNRSLPLPRETQLREFLRQRQASDADRHPHLPGGSFGLRAWRGSVYLTAAAPAAGSYTLAFRSPELELPDRSVLRWKGDGQRPELRVHIGPPDKAGEGAGYPPARRLRKVFQAQDIPPWERSAVPVMMHDGKLAQVGSRWSSRAFAALKRARNLTLEWLPADR